MGSNHQASVLNSDDDRNLNLLAFYYFLMFVARLTSAPF